MLKDNVSCKFYCLSLCVIGANVFGLYPRFKFKYIPRFEIMYVLNVPSRFKLFGVCK